MSAVTAGHGRRRFPPFGRPEARSAPPFKPGPIGRSPRRRTSRSLNAKSELDVNLRASRPGNVGDRTGTGLVGLTTAQLIEPFSGHVASSEEAASQFVIAHRRSRRPRRRFGPANEGQKPAHESRIGGFTHLAPSGRSGQPQRKVARFGCPRDRWTRYRMMPISLHPSCPSAITDVGGSGELSVKSLIQLRAVPSVTGRMRSCATQFQAASGCGRCLRSRSRSNVAREMS